MNLSHEGAVALVVVVVAAVGAGVWLYLGQSPDAPVDNSPSEVVSVVPSGGKMSISQAGLLKIIQFEGWVDHPYNDQAGYATIGYGHLLHKSPVDQSDLDAYPEPLTKMQGAALLNADVQSAVEAVNNYVTVPLRQDQFDALVSFTFNLGVGTFEKSSVLTAVNNQDWPNVIYWLNQYVHADGEVVEDLVSRRAQESEAFA